VRCSCGGGSGIRTHVGVTQTCFQDMRLKPLGHPSKRTDFTIRRSTIVSRGVSTLLLDVSVDVVVRAEDFPDF
jgi:hypothetical protein